MLIRKLNLGKWLDAIRQDARLAWRMLIKYPGLTAIGGFSMAIAIAIGSLTFEGVTETLHTTLPFDDGDRLVAIQFASDAQGQPQRRVLRDFVEWRDGLTTIRQLGAFRNVTHNLRIDGGNPDAIRVAEVTASAFAIATTPPLEGRTIQPQDEALGAPPVIVIGADVWHSRFAGAPVVGRTIALGDVAHTIIGVMPPGFQFPVSHDYWTPLRLTATEFDRLQGPELFVFGKLAPGRSLDQANAELAALGQRTVNAFPEQYARLRLLALPYTREHVEIDRPQIEWMLRMVQLLVGGLLVVVASNLAILMYARTVTRLGEIAVRHALGASRARLLSQLFIEALGLSLAGALIGLAIADVTLDTVIRPMLEASGARVPFWITLDLNLTTIAYAIALAIVAAFIVGVVPGLHTTGEQTHTNLRALSGGTGRPLGGLWTSLIVIQVAIAAAILPLSIYLVAETARMELSGPTFAAGRFLIANIAGVKRPEEIVSRLQRQPDIEQVAFSSGVPGYEGSRTLRFESDRAESSSTLDANTLDVSVGLFQAYEAAILAGRDLTMADINSTNVIVNRTFAGELAGDAGVLGRRFSFTKQPGADASSEASYQIVGIVEDFPKFPAMPGENGEGTPTLYRAAAPSGLPLLTIRYRAAVGNDATGQLRRMIAAVEPTAPLSSATPLTEFYQANRAPFRWIAIGLALITISVLLLSAGGIYALMSFTVAQRTREIGIRAALGANPRRLLAGIFGRALLQIGAGLALGTLLSGALVLSTLERDQSVMLFIAVAVVIFFVGLTATIGPARRGLRISPTEALRIDA